MTNFKVGEYVTASVNINNIPQNAVGLIRNIKNSTASVFFVGVGKLINVEFDKIRYLDIKKTGKPY